MKRTTKIALAVGAALTLGLAGAAVNAQGYGPGWGGAPCFEAGPGGYGPGPGYGMHGWGRGYGPGPGYGMHGGGRGYGPGPGYGMMGQGWGMFGAYPGAVDERLAALKSDLGITAKQEAAWNTFAAKSKKQVENRQAWFEKMQQARAAGSLPERLAQQNEFAKQHQADREAAAAALKDLYAALTPDQKALADQALGGVGRGYGPGYYRGGPGGRFR